MEKKRPKIPHLRRDLAWYEKPLHGVDPKVMDYHPHPQPPGSRRARAQMRGNHRKWPMGTEVSVLIPYCAEGEPRYVWGTLKMTGKIVGHLREHLGSCSVEFPLTVDLGDGNGARFCHTLSFARLRRLSNHITRRSQDGYPNRR